MKKLATLLLAAGLVLGASSSAKAIDFKAKGEWLINFDIGNGTGFVDKTRGGKTAAEGAKHITGTQALSDHRGYDNFYASQRVRLQLDAVASEALSGTVYFEIGDQVWGASKNGGALGADGIAVEVKSAYLDWVVPNTELKLRMGIQTMRNPSYTFGAGVFDEDVAGIAASYKFSDNASATLAWMRPYNDNHTANVANRANAIPTNYMDNVDIAFLSVPFNFDGVKVTPWGMFGWVGPSVYRDGMIKYDSNRLGGVADNGTDFYGNTFAKNFFPGITPYVSYTKGKAPVSNYNNLYAAGLTGQLTLWDPFRIAWDFNYAGSSTSEESMNRSGWLLNALAEYKMDWGTPGFIAWWGSGDDGNLKNGSEVMPNFGSNATYTLTRMGTKGDPYIGNNNDMGRNAAGTWGLAARVKDISFFEGLKHLVQISWIQGTNDPSMAGYITGKKSYKGLDVTSSKTAGRSNFYRPWTDFNTGPGIYMTSMDNAMEVDFLSEYKIYQNLTMFVNLSYIALWLDQGKSMWGGSGLHSSNQGKNIRGVGTTDAYNANIMFRYAF